MPRTTGSSHVTPEQHRTIVARASTGEKYLAIAHDLGRSVSTIAKHAKRDLGYRDERKALRGDWAAPT